MVVILRCDGVDRTYPCDNRFDAEVLFDALSRAMRGRGRVELWDGMDMLSVYEPNF